MTAKDACVSHSVCACLTICELFLELCLGVKECFLGKQRQSSGIIFVGNQVDFDGWSCGGRTDRGEPGAFLCSTRSHMRRGCNQTAICEAGSRSPAVCACCGCLAPDGSRFGVSGASVYSLLSNPLIYLSSNIVKYTIFLSYGKIQTSIPLYSTSPHNDFSNSDFLIVLHISSVLGMKSCISISTHIWAFCIYLNS